jgi:hypothetical protein
MTLITNSLEPQLFETLCYYETAAKLWQEIENQHSNQKIHSQIYHLKQKIIKITQKSRDVPTLIGHVRAKYEELKLYRPNTTDLKVLQERDEMDRIYTFLAALEPNYELIRAWILLLTERMSFEAITTQIRQAELRYYSQ